MVQPYGDSPLDEETVGENVYLNIISRAKRYVWICTPYLIIDNEMMTALCLAAKNGVDVRIITPGVPDKWYVHMVTQAHYAQLVEAGVKIWEYTPGFIHAKSFVADGKRAVVGSINLDYRSFSHHFECAAYMQDCDCIEDIEADFAETLKLCRRVSMETVKKEKPLVKITGYIMKIVAPLL